MLDDKIDCAKFLTWFIENYPESVSATRHADAEFWKRFKKYLGNQKRRNLQLLAQR